MSASKLGVKRLFADGPTKDCRLFESSSSLSMRELARASGSYSGPIKIPAVADSELCTRPYLPLALRSFLWTEAESGIPKPLSSLGLIPAMAVATGRATAKPPSPTTEKIECLYI